MWSNPQLPQREEGDRLTSASGAKRRHEHSVVQIWMRIAFIWIKPATKQKHSGSFQRLLSAFTVCCTFPTSKYEGGYELCAENESNLLHNVLIGLNDSLHLQLYCDITLSNFELMESRFLFCSVVSNTTQLNNRQLRYMFIYVSKIQFFVLF